MNSYMYPTEDGWFENEVIGAWKESGKRTVCFPWLTFTPGKLPENKDESFWMYIYYTENSTKNSTLNGTVPFRVRVVFHDNDIIKGTDICTVRESALNPRAWFKCDLIEEIRSADGKHLRRKDFDHPEGKELAQTMFNSIPPVKRQSPMVTVQSTSYYVND